MWSWYFLQDTGQIIIAQYARGEKKENIGMPGSFHIILNSYQS